MTTPPSSRTQPPRLLRRPEVEDRTGLKRSTLYDLLERGGFPQPVPIGERGVAWVEAEVDNWIQGRIAARGAQ